MPSGQRLEGKVAIVTGAGTRGEIPGTGQAAAILMAQEGAKILLCDIDIERAEETLDVIEKDGGIGKIFIGDVTSEKDCESMINEAVKQFGKLDILVNNAGVTSRMMLLETSEPEWDRVMDINTKGTFLGIKTAIPAMKYSGGGSIVNISSQMGLVGADYISPQYQASKGAVRIPVSYTHLRAHETPEHLVLRLVR